MGTLVLVLHVTFNLVWIGSIACVGWLTAASAKDPDPVGRRTVAEVAARLYGQVAVPAFVGSFAFGLTRFAMHADYYMKSHWFHGKLTFALVVIALHHVLGARAKRAAAEPVSSSAGGVQAASTSAILVGALLASAFLSVVFVLYKGDLVP